ncbi:MAG: hypothetical protein LW720_08425 [Pirellula sp.]|jgi:hypothetical protein|nr:hypothetical protein [Pirellula sp.]
MLAIPVLRKPVPSTPAPQSQLPSRIGSAAWIGCLLRSACLLWISSLSALGQDPEPRLNPDANTLRQWVEELGDSRFEVRDRASGKLSKLSTDQLDHLQELLKGSTDPEITVRLSSVVAKLKAERQQQIVSGFLRDPDILNDHGLHGWSSFARVAGPSRSSKRLFLQLYERHAELVEEALEDPKLATERGRKVLSRIQDSEIRRTEGDKSDGLALLYCACASQGDEDSKIAAMALRILLRAPYNQCLRDPQSKRPIETMMEQWAGTIDGSYEQTTALQIMVEANLSPVRSLAKRMLLSYESNKNPTAKDPSVPNEPVDPIEPRDIARAFQVFFKFGKAEDLPLLEKWLDNTDVCEEISSLNPPGLMVPRQPIPGAPDRPLATVELRDAALLACMQIAGMDYRLHFPTVRNSALWGFIPSSIALKTGSDDVRAARLEAWKQRPQ